MTQLTSLTRQQVEQKLTMALSPVYLSVIDESWKHAGHAGAISGKGHFVLHVVSEQFKGVPRIDRNRMVFEILKQEMASDIHALTVVAQIPSEWESDGGQ
jgi:BolA protein